MLHTISNKLVDEALENDCTHLVFEKLKGIRERLPHAKAVHKWAFHRLYEYVTYKAESEVLVVKQINPAYTSQRCSKCGFTHEDNRPNDNGQDEFECLKCGYDIHADYSAPVNGKPSRILSRNSASTSRPSDEATTSQKVQQEPPRRIHIPAERLQHLTSSTRLKIAGFPTAGGILWVTT